MCSPPGHMLLMRKFICGMGAEVELKLRGCAALVQWSMWHIIDERWVPLNTAKLRSCIQVPSPFMHEM